MTKCLMKKLLLLLFGSFLLMSSSPKKHLPIHINLQNVDDSQLKSIDTDFFDEHLKFHLLFLDSREHHCKIYKKVSYHKGYDYWIIHKENSGPGSLILFQLDKKTKFITNHKIISEINDIDGSSCFSRSVLYDNYFEIITVCKDQVYEKKLKKIVPKWNTTNQKYNYQFEAIK